MTPEPISAHITYAEATKTSKPFDNTPNASQLQNMKDLAENVFEPLRAHFGKPINIDSMFRSPKVNEAVGGKPNSQHLANSGAAMDINNDKFKASPSNKEIFDYIKDNLDYDQILNEHNLAWVHVSYKKGHNRKMVLNI